MVRISFKEEETKLSYLQSFTQLLLSFIEVTEVSFERLSFY